MLTTQYGLQENNNVYVKESVPMLLGIVDQDKTMRSIAQRYQRSLDTIKRKFDDVLSALLRFTADSIKSVEGEFTRVSSILRIDNRYWPTINVLAICNFEMKFIYAYVGVRGRAHDTKVLTYCAKHEASFPHMPNNKYYLVDSGYPTRTGYLGPHRRVRYHLDLFFRGGPPSNMREMFNRKHSGLRSVIERTLGVWKVKWRILDRQHPKYDLTRWIKIVTATMALHNFVCDSHRENHDFLHWQTVEHYQAHGDDGDNDDDDDDDGDGDHNEHIAYERHTHK